MVLRVAGTIARRGVGLRGRLVRVICWLGLGLIGSWLIRHWLIGRRAGSLGWLIGG